MHLTGEQKLVLVGHLFVLIGIVLAAIVAGLSQWLRGEYDVFPFFNLDLLLDIGPFRVCSTKYNLCSSLSTIKEKEALTKDKLLMTARVGVLIFIIFTFVGIVLSGSSATPALQANPKLRIASIVFVAVGMIGGVMALIVMGVWKNQHKMTLRVGYFLCVAALAITLCGIPMLYPNEKRISI